MQEQDQQIEAGTDFEQARDEKLARLRVLGKDLWRATGPLSHKTSYEQRAAMVVEIAEIVKSGYLDWVEDAYANDKMMIESEYGMDPGTKWDMLAQECKALQWLIREARRMASVAKSRGAAYAELLSPDLQLLVQERVWALDHHVQWFSHRALYGGQKKPKYAKDDPRIWNTAPIFDKRQRILRGLA